MSFFNDLKATLEQALAIEKGLKNLID